MGAGISSHEYISLEESLSICSQRNALLAKRIELHKTIMDIQNKIWKWTHSLLAFCQGSLILLTKKEKKFIALITKTACGCRGPWRISLPNIYIDTYVE